MTPIVVSGEGGHHASVVELVTSCGFHPYSSGLTPGLSARECAYANGWGLLLGAVNRHNRFRSEVRSFANAPAIVSPHAHVAADVSLGSGAQVHPGAIVRTLATLGDDVVVNSGAIVEHHVEIASGAFIAPGAIILGRCSVGVCVTVGAGAILLPGVSLGDYATVGAGAVVTRPIREGEKVLGVPARSMK